MRLLTKAARLAVLAMALQGCGRLEVYTDPAMPHGKETGFKFYTPKPYLLVGRVAADKPVEISVKYLPDLNRPLYAKARPGWLGSTALSMTFSETGTLTTFNQTTDTKANEMVTALGGFLTSVATANKTNREARLAELAPDAGKIAPEVKQAAAELRAEATDDAVRNQHITAEEAEKLRLYAASLELAASHLESPKPETAAPFIAALLKGVSEGIRTQIKPPSNERDIGRRRIAAIQARIEGARARLAVVLPAEPFFALYEIVMKDGVTTLVEVKLPEKP